MVKRLLFRAWWNYVRRLKKDKHFLDVKRLFKNKANVFSAWKVSEHEHRARLFKNKSHNHLLRPTPPGPHHEEKGQ